MISQNKEPAMMFRKRLPISSLQAAICNVALFKNMKEKQFRDEIHIVYCKQGVFLEANTQSDWNEACQYTENFLKSKKIALLAFGFEREAYEELIIKGLKEYTRKIKDLGEECPYINIIHYQKFRKSCEYMDKEKYVEPLKDWENKSKANPNFAFLIVEPRNRFQDVKKNLLEFLYNRTVPLQVAYLTPPEFIYTFFNSSMKETIKEAFTKKFIELSIVEPDKGNRLDQRKEDKVIRVANYSDVDLEEFQVTLMKSHKNISKLGLEFVSSKDIKSQIGSIKNFVRESNAIAIFEKMHLNLSSQYGQNYALIPYKRAQKQKYLQLIDKFTNTTFSQQQRAAHIKKYLVCEYREMQFFDTIEGNSSAESSDSSNYYITHKISINSCPFMAHEYPCVKSQDLDTFIIYIQQLSHYYNNYMVRFYGICVHPEKPSVYYLIFDYHPRTLAQFESHGLILDNCQVGNMLLQILYLIRYLHGHDEPRCVGKLALQQVYWPMCMVLPYLSEDQENSVEGDVRLVGLLMRRLLGEQAEDFEDIVKSMLRGNKYDRVTLAKCIATFEEILEL